MLASSKSSLQEAEDSLARLEMSLEQYEIHMARGGSSDRVAANDLTQARSAYERAKAVRDEIRGVPQMERPPKRRPYRPFEPAPIGLCWLRAKGRH